MPENGYRAIGHIDGAEIGVRLTETGQDILIQQNGIGQYLVQLLNAVDPAAKLQTVCVGDVTYWRISHTDPVDELLMRAADLFIAIRYLHPTLVQLQLQLPMERR